MHAPAAAPKLAATKMMIRSATVEDSARCGEIFYDAFASIATQHYFPVEPGSPEFTHFKAAQMLTTEGFHAIVAERDGQVMGAAFTDERDVIAGVGPIVVDPAAQDEGVGRELLEVILHRQRQRRAPGVRLVQTAYHYRSLALYAKLGFTIREPLSVLQGTSPETSVPGSLTRPATQNDLDSCGALCVRVHGHDRNGELRDSIAAGTAQVVTRSGRIVAYASGYG